MKNKSNYICLIAALLVITSCSKKVASVNNTTYSSENLSGVKTSPEVITDPRLFDVSVVPTPVIHHTLPSVNRQIELNTSINEIEEGIAVTDEKAIKRKVRAENKSAIKEVKEMIKQKQGTQRTGIGTLLLVIFAIILPPLAVLLVDGLSGPFWLSILLTLLLYVPGLIYALYRVFRAENM